MNYINLNGKFLPADEAAITTDNRAFRYGYGLFETMLVRNGAIELKEYHRERLFAGLNTLHFDTSPIRAHRLEEEIMRTVKKNGLDTLCRVRLQVYAGNGGMYHIHNQKPDFTIMCSPVEEHVTQLNENGLSIGIASGLRKSIDTLSNLKSCNALIYAMAAQEAKEQKWNDALICNANSHIIESAIANIFWIKDEVVYTPPLSDGCVAGVMRRFVLAQLPLHSYKIIEKSLAPDELLKADEVFLTNAIRGIKWVRTINEITYGQEQTKKIFTLLFEEKHK